MAYPIFLIAKYGAASARPRHEYGAGRCVELLSSDHIHFARVARTAERAEECGPEDEDEDEDGDERAHADVILSRVDAARRRSIGRGPCCCENGRQTGRRGIISNGELQLR
eukprot:1555747-Pleurochrysis_carterae.AAC.2